MGIMLAGLTLRFHTVDAASGELVFDVAANGTMSARLIRVRRCQAKLNFLATSRPAATASSIAMAVEIGNGPCAA